MQFLGFTQTGNPLCFRLQRSSHSMFRWRVPAKCCAADQWRNCNRRDWPEHARWPGPGSPSGCMSSRGSENKSIYRSYLKPIPTSFSLTNLFTTHRLFDLLPSQSIAFLFQLQSRQNVLFAIGQLLVQSQFPFAGDLRVPRCVQRIACLEFGRFLFGWHNQVVGGWGQLLNVHLFDQIRTNRSDLGSVK